MIRKTIVLSVYISLLTALAGAVDVNIPDADNRIPANAYESYVYHDSSIKSIQEGALRDFQKSKAYDKTKQLYIDNGLSEKEAETAIRESYVGPLNMYEGQTEIIDHSGKGIRFLVPYMSYYKVQENNITDKYTAYDIIANDITIGLIVENKQNWQSSDYMGKSFDSITEDDLRKDYERPINIKEFNSLSYKPEDIHGASFSYAGLIDSYWDSLYGKIKKNNKAQFYSNLNFAFDNDSTIRYHVGLTEAKQETGQVVSPILVNYVLPSIKPLTDSNAYSHTTKIDGENFIYRILNDAKISATLADFKRGLFYKSPSGITQTIFIESIAKDSGATTLELDSFLTEVIIDTIKSPEGYIYFSKRVVWNDGVPGILVEQEKANKEGIMLFYTQDGTTALTSILSYNRNISYTKEQLRNMITDVRLVTIPEMFKGNVDLANIEDIVKKDLEK
ncbi:hypothetical protein [uncultured Veillonella sp.]|uniref:hypothetical protein n=1 Tax=uncultured Veillonella sp. TaxID=159268 RepID=UPI0028DB69ED|nr:hypothetical protein [uncultured Veillonella sp.]